MASTLGDVYDIKRELAALLSSPLFRQTLTSVVVAKQDGFMPLLPAAIFQEERLSKLVFPMAELVAYREKFVEQDLVKHVEHDIGVRWTAVAKDERTVTRYVELLTRATVDILFGAVLPAVDGGPILVTEVDYSPLVPAVEHPYVKSSLVMITVPVWRD